MTLSVLALTRYERNGASSRVRFLQYVPHLEKLGAKVSVHALLPRDYLTRLYADGSRSPVTVAAAWANRLWTLIAQRDVDLIWLQREMLPFAPFLAEDILLAGRKLVIDFDDAHHLYYKDRRSKFVQAFWGDKIERLIRRADAVTVGNPGLAEIAQAAGARNVHMIPSAVDVAAYQVADAGPPERFTVGWIGTPMTADESLPMILDPLGKFLNETDAECVLVGPRENQFPGLKARTLPWREGEEARVLAKMSAGICPLPDTPWHRGKSGYKIIQYMAAGLPALVSPVGIAAELTVPGETGFHCRTSQEWFDALMVLYRDSKRRAAFGRRAHELALQNYDTAAAAGRIFGIMRSCAGGTNA
ncbi:MAG: glycosyltransferase [Rhodobacteraceae bacterium]|nr:glycosyltransferase [Paracoccaceae bacterium]